MLGFYVLLKDPDANVIIIALLLQWVFFVSHDLRYIADQPRPLATGEYAAANRRCWSSYNSCQWGEGTMNEKTLNIYYKRAMPGSQEIASGFFFFTCRTQVHQLCKVPPAAYFVKHHFNQYIYNNNNNNNNNRSAYIFTSEQA